MQQDSRGTELHSIRDLPVPVGAQQVALQEFYRYPGAKRQKRDGLDTRRARELPSERQEAASSSEM